MNFAIYTNILTPYRKHFYDALYEECKKNGDSFYVILMAATEPNRNWKYDDFKTEYTILLGSKTLTVGNVYIHFNKNLRNVLEDLHLDVIVCAGSYLCPGLWSVLFRKKKLEYKTFYWSESHLNEVRNYSGIKIQLREFLRKIIYKRFDGFWYAGKLSLEFIQKYADEKAELFFMPNLIDEKRYQIVASAANEEKKYLRQKYCVGQEKVVFICPARLSSVKGIDKFIDLFSKCSEKGKATILVAGDGELKSIIEEKINKENVDVRLLGFKNEGEVIELYKLSDVFLLPSLSDPNPLTCIEALWAGLPLFISEHCGNYPEVVSEGKNGYVFSYKNEKDTIDKLQKIINSDENWNKTAKDLSQQIAEKKYKTEYTVKKVMDYFRTI